MNRVCCLVFVTALISLPAQSAPNFSMRSESLVEVTEDPEHPEREEGMNDWL